MFTRENLIEEIESRAEPNRELHSKALARLGFILSRPDLNDFSREGMALVLDSALVRIRLSNDSLFESK